MQIYFPSQDAVREDVILIISAISLFSASCHPGLSRPRTGASPVASPRLASENARVEGERSGDVGGEVAGVVAPWIDVEFVGDFARCKNFVERVGTRVETVIVLITAIEINFQPGKIRGTRQRER